MGVAQLSKESQVIGRVEPHPARALHDRLHDRGRELVSVACEQLAQRRRVGLIEAGVDAAGRARRENLRGEHRGEQVVHAVDGVTDRHRAEGVAVVAAAQGEQACASRAGRLEADLDRHLDRDRSRVGEEDVLERLRRQLHQPRRQLDRRRVREPAEHHVRHPLQLRAGGGVERRMTVAVNRAPPRRHPVDQLAAVGERDSNAARGRDQQRLGDPGHRPVRMPHVGAIECQQSSVSSGVAHLGSIESER